MTIIFYSILFSLRLLCGDAAMSRLHPDAPPTWQLNRSTIVMYCDYGRLVDPSELASWSNGIIDWDWSHGKEIWAKGQPMNSTEVVLEQVAAQAAAFPGVEQWVYRNNIKMLPWFSSVRRMLSDTSSAPWLLKFAGSGPFHVPTCDNNTSPPLCSDKYHDQSQTPGYPQGFDGPGSGNCSAPACNVGPGLPTGEYLYDPRAWNVAVNNVTLLEWFVTQYVLADLGPSTSGVFLDDTWWVKGSNGGPTEFEAHAVQDMGLSKSELHAIASSFDYMHSKVLSTLLASGMMEWHMMYPYSSTSAPPVPQASCAAALRGFCTPTSPLLSPNVSLMYSFSPGGGRTDPSNLTDAIQDITNFLLIRGPHAAIGHAWLGCDKAGYTFPPALNIDVGEPLGPCAELGTTSGVFVRQWSKASVTMNCSSWEGTILQHS